MKIIENDMNLINQYRTLKNITSLESSIAKKIIEEELQKRGYSIQLRRHESYEKIQ